MSDDADAPELNSELSELAAVAAAIEPGVMRADLEALERRTTALLAGEKSLLSSLQSQPTHRRVGLVLALSVAVTIGALVMRPRADLAEYPALHMVGTLVILFAVTAAASARLLRPLHLPPPSRALGHVLLVVGAFMPPLLSLVPSGHEGAPPGAGAELAIGCARCLGFGAVLGMPVLLAAFALRRARVDGAAVGALAGVAAGLTGNLALQVHCAVTDSVHLLLGHAFLIFIAAAGAWLWRRHEGTP